MSNIATIPVQQSVVDTRYTQDVIPVLDTGKFEHMQRIAQVMAHTAMLPDSLRFKDTKDATSAFDQQTMVATCFRIVNQAVRWGLDPFAVSDCASLIKGRLTWEGKLVHAVIAAKLGINLNYDFFDDDKARQLGVRVSGVLPGETVARTIEGRVVDWHTGDKGPWSSEGAWKRQLRYRGAREWARAHAPHIMLGVYVDDELESIAALDVPSGQRALRMKDVTPPALLTIPDIPDKEADNSVAQVAKEADIEPAELLSDADGFITKLADDIALCTSAEELAEIAECNAEMIARLPKKQKAKAEKMLKEAAE